MLAKENLYSATRCIIFKYSPTSSSFRHLTFKLKQPLQTPVLLFVLLSLSGFIAMQTRLVRLVSKQSASRDLFSQSWSNRVSSVPRPIPDSVFIHHEDPWHRSCDCQSRCACDPPPETCRSICTTCWSEGLGWPWCRTDRCGKSARWGQSGCMLCRALKLVTIKHSHPWECLMCCHKCWYMRANTTIVVRRCALNSTPLISRHIGVFFLCNSSCTALNYAPQIFVLTASRSLTKLS